MHEVVHRNKLVEEDRRTLLYRSITGGLGNVSSVSFIIRTRLTEVKACLYRERDWTAVLRQRYQFKKSSNGVLQKVDVVLFRQAASKDSSNVRRCDP